MGLMGFFKSRLIEVIECTDALTQTIVYRYPLHNHQIKMGTRLTVRESQVAVFVHEGTIADMFGPGRYILTTENLPVLTVLKSWKYGSNAPFHAEVFYVNTKPFTNQKWSTVNPIMMKDSEFGMLHLKANGVFSFKVTNAEKFMKEIFGTNQIYETAYILGQLKSMLLSGLSKVLGETGISAVDLGAHYDELGETADINVQERFIGYGLELCSFLIDHISLPEEVEKIRNRSSTGAVGDKRQQNDAASIAGNELNTAACTECGHQLSVNMKFCPECGTAVKR